MKPLLKNIQPSFGNSFTLKEYVFPNDHKKPFFHFHPEIELVFVNGGSGKRRVGTHVSWFYDGDLILLGSNLPHFGFTDAFTSHVTEVLVQMKPDFLGPLFFETPEMNAIKQLFERSKSGISYFGNTKKEMGRRIELLPKLPQARRLLELLNILLTLSESEEYEILNVNGVALEIGQQDNDRINMVYEFVKENFQKAIALDEIAEQASMTVPAFCRYFKKMSDKTFIQFLNEYRIAHACKLLSESGMNITAICFESGFNSAAQFNRLFRDLTGKSPSEYRKGFRYVFVGE